MQLASPMESATLYVALDDCEIEAEQLFAATSAGCNGREEGALEELRALMESEAAATDPAGQRTQIERILAEARASLPAEERDSFDRFAARVGRHVRVAVELCYNLGDLYAESMQT